MTLVFDIGNSAIKGALYEDDIVVELFRWSPEKTQIPVQSDAVNITSDRERFSEEVIQFVTGRSFRRIGCVSVVPAWTTMLREAVESVCGRRVHVLTTASPVPLPVSYRTPETLGVDRLALAVGAWKKYAPRQEGRPIIAIDAGTAVTHEVIDASGVYLGGPIGPGPDLLRDALSDGTAQLPTAPLKEPETAVGRSTDEALQAGIMYGFLDGVRGMIARIGEELEAQPFVVATGGWADWLSGSLPEIDVVDADLVLFGVNEMLIHGGDSDR